MSWQVLIVLSAVLLGFATLVMRSQMKDNRAKKAQYVINVVLYLVLMLVAIGSADHFKHVDVNVFRRYWLQFILGGFGFTLSNVTTYKLLRYVDAATGSILSMANPIMTLLLAWLILHERLGLMSAAGCAIFLVGIVYGLTVSIGSSREYLPADRYKIIGFAVVTALLYGASAVNEKWLLSRISLGSYVIVGWGWQCVAAIIVALIMQPRAFLCLRYRSIVVPAVMTGILRALAGLLFVIAQTRYTNVGILTVVSSGRVIIVILFGAILLKERTRVAEKFTAALCSLIGLVTIFH